MTVTEKKNPLSAEIAEEVKEVTLPLERISQRVKGKGQQSEEPLLTTDPSTQGTAEPC